MNADVVANGDTAPGGGPCGSSIGTPRVRPWPYAAYTSTQADIAAMSTSNRIEINPEIMLGKPVIRGTRITVELLLRSLSEGATEADLLEAYPHLTHEDIQAAIAYAADAVGRERQAPLNNRA